MSAWQDLRRTALATWRQRPARERSLIVVGVTVLLLAAAWTGWIGPAWSTWREAPQRQAALEAQTRQMLKLQAQAQHLQTPGRIERDKALRMLSASTQSLLGKGAQLTPQGEGLRVSVKAATAAGLAQWLSQAREQALAIPSQVQLQREDTAGAETSWSGTLVLRLP